MVADPAILKRIRGCPFARSGRVLVRFRANGECLFARRSGEPLARLRLTGDGDEVVLLYPSHRGGSTRRLRRQRQAARRSALVLLCQFLSNALKLRGFFTYYAFS